MSNELDPKLIVLLFRLCGVASLHCGESIRGQYTRGASCEAG